MTKIAVFDAKPYDRASFDAANAGRYAFRYFETRLTAASCTAFSGDLTECDEGDLVWLPKAELLGKKMWAGDRLFLRALDERTDFFTLKLRYEGERLVEAKFGA